MGDIETVKIKHGDGDYAIINRTDFDPEKHELHDGDQRVADGLTDEERKTLRELEIKRTAEANRGVTPSPAVAGADRNPSGTFSEPTPTDIRFPDKDATEFEHNHGAFVGKSAAEIREAAGLPDKPGGIKSDVDIPEDWSALHWKQQVVLGQQISGRDDLNAADAREVIEAEFQRRKA
ncbi:hypothetical protein SAMN02745157_4854 [Kaistia soli DSM 19436]|uniref:Uncharacterized protein n=1 Tax=Kaistia soli DSM 19436 TaxID=1122133 RepID=A0A1M5MRS3_9HYPH|nr:hypothetical protein [Kaistia soli]SHG79579.1 hypothetical protein SAMN02745157_4854 [Kaistia soli DSM 19436]